MRELMGTLGRVGMVAVAALLIAGCLAAPAAAEQRPEAKEANDFIDYCFRAGGDPEVIEGDQGNIIVQCNDLPGVGDMVCDFDGAARDCWIQGPGDPGGVRPTQPVDGVFVEEEPAQVTPQAMYEVVPIWTLYENDGGTEAPLRAAGGSSGRITVLSGSAVTPADDASSSRVTLGASSPGLATVLGPAPAAEEIIVPELAEDEVVTLQSVLAPVAEEIAVPELAEDGVVTVQPLSPLVEEIVIPVLEANDEVTAQPVLAPVAEPILVPEIQEDETVTTQPVQVPVVEEIDVPELDEDEVVTTQPVLAPVAEEIAVPELTEDEEVTTDLVPAADEQP